MLKTNTPHVITLEDLCSVYYKELASSFGINNPKKCLRLCLVVSPSHLNTTFEIVQFKGIDEIFLYQGCNIDEAIMYYNRLP